MDDLNIPSSNAYEEYQRKKAVLQAESLIEADGRDSRSGRKAYCRFHITRRGVVWMEWPLSIRKPNPIEAPSTLVVGFDEFMRSTYIHENVIAVMGEPLLQRAFDIIKYDLDLVKKLPEKVQVHIVSYLDIKSLSRFSRTSHYLKVLCDSNIVWERLVIVHYGQPEDFKRRCVNYGKATWKTIFEWSKRNRLAILNLCLGIGPPPPLSSPQSLCDIQDLSSIQSTILTTVLESADNLASPLQDNDQEITDKPSALEFSKTKDSVSGR